MSSGRQDGMQWWAAQEWFSALLREAFQIQQDLKPREVANIAWACAKVQQALTQQGSALEPALLQALCSAVHAVLGNMDAQGLANSLWSLVRVALTHTGAAATTSICRWLFSHHTASSGPPLAVQAASWPLPRLAHGVQPRA